MKQKLLSTMFAFALATGLQAQTLVSTAAELEQALITATSGTQIWVQAGIYQPSGTLVVPAGVRLYGGFSGTETDLSQRDVETNATILDGQNTFGVVRLNATSELNGFTIQNGFAQAPHRNGGGVYADANAMIENCIITGNRAQLHGGGLFAQGVVTVSHSTIIDNHAPYGDNIFGDCLIVSSFCDDGGGGPITPPEPPDPPCVSPAIAGQSTPAQTCKMYESFNALLVAATGTEPLTYQWYSHTANSNSGGTPVAAGGAALTFTPPSTHRGEMYYYVTVTNACGSVTSAVSGAQTVAIMELSDPFELAALSCSFVVHSGTFGTVTWGGNADIEEKTWTVPADYGIPARVWSDAVQVSNCAKTEYASIGSSATPGGVDCRQATHGFHGHYFSWCFMKRYEAMLCPAPWRVPTRQDFIDLHIALGGTGTTYGAPGGDHIGLIPKYFGTTVAPATPGGIWGGSLYTRSTDNSLLLFSAYWSSEGGTATNNNDAAYALHFAGDFETWRNPPMFTGYLALERQEPKRSGLALRCVRDV